jgi:hydroxymethylpyrimidine/phosphomethylpyrimidine kinase
MRAVALTIAGSDPSGGAGIQADLKTFHQFGVYGQAVITLLTVQNTQRVSRVEVIAPGLIREQLEAVLEDMLPRAAKTGALGNAETIESVGAMAKAFPFPLVVDPVMISKHGARLLAPEGEAALKQNLLPHAFLLTPNIPEAEALTGRRIESEREAEAAAARLLDTGCRWVLIKGGHSQGEPVDLLYGHDETIRLPGRRIHTRNTHGTGCTFSAAITALLACGESIENAARQGKAYIQSAIENAEGLGHGHGPVNHFVRAELTSKSHSQ